MGENVHDFELVKPYLELKVFFVRNNVLHKEVADFLGISEQSFSAKINRRGQDFTTSQVKALCLEYGLDANLFFLE